MSAKVGGARQNPCPLRKCIFFEGEKKILVSKSNIFIHEKTLLICPLRLKALVDMSAKNVIFLDGSP